MRSSGCQYSQYKENGLEQSLTCSLTGKYCIKQRYCPTQRRLINTDDWQKCTQLQKEDIQMANNKKNIKPSNHNNIELEKKDIVEVVEPVEETVETIAANDAVVEPTVEKEDTEVKNKEEKYIIVLARPSYFIINKNGNNIVINQINNYKKGDVVIL